MEQCSADDLMMFARLVDAGSFTRASESMGLPKSTLSRRIKLLEERLGEKLLHRTTRRFRVTEFGLRLMTHARDLCNRMEAVSDFVQSRQHAPSGRLRISMPGDFASLLLADTLAAFVALHPEITLDLDLTPRQVNLVDEGFDLALRVGTLANTSDTLRARRVMQLRYGLYASHGYLAEQGAPEQPEDLRRHQAVLLQPGSKGIRSWILQNGSLRWEGLPPGRLTANSPELLLRLARAGSGIVSAPVSFALPYLLKDELVRVLPAWHPPAYPVWALFPDQRLMPPKTRAFLDMLDHALVGLD